MKIHGQLTQLVWLLLLTGLAANAQWQNGLWVEKQAYNWYFGINAGLNFDTSPPTVLTDGLVTPPTTTSSSVISDSSGNLLFYLGGNTVWDKDHQVMPDGEGLVGNNELMQCTLIVPVPSNPNKYYIFTIKPDFWLEFESSGAVYSEIDITLNNGLGDVTENKNILLEQQAYARITATHHADGNKVWVMLHTIGTNDFKAFLVSEEGVSLSPVVSSIGASVTDYPDTMGQIKFSPDGTKIVKSIQTALSPRVVEVFNFDNETGVVTDLLVTLDGSDYPEEFLGIQGLEFSPNSKLLYTSGWFSGAVRQFNLDAGSEEAIKDSGVIISTTPPPYNVGLQLAPDGKIYIADTYISLFDPNPNIENHALSVINYPNNLGLAAGFQMDGLSLDSGESHFALPNFIQSYFASGILYEGNACPGKNLSFSTIRIPGIESIVWDFGDPESGNENSSSEIEPIHSFSGPGIFTVTATITSNGAEQTATTSIVIVPAPDVAVPSSVNLTSCADVSGNALFNLESLTPEILNGQDPAVYTVTYYANEADLQTGTYITEPENFISGGQVIYAKVTSSETECFSTLDFVLVVDPLPQVIVPIVAAQCANEDGTAVFNLSDQEAIILGNQNPGDYTINFYSTELDIEANNPIQLPESYTTSGQSVYAAITNNTSNCTAFITIELNVIPAPLADNPGDVTICDSYVLPALNPNNSYWTGAGGTGLELPAGSLISETTTLYIVAQSADNAACTTENALDIEIIPTPLFSLGGPYITCDASGFSIAVNAINFNLDQAEYVWTFDGGITGNNSPEIAVTEFGTYEVTVTVNGCASTQHVEVVQDNPVIDVDFEAGCNGNTYWLAAVSVDDSFNIETATYLWSGPGLTSTEREFEVKTAGTYNVQITTHEGCIIEASFEVENTTCEIPRGISPNGDGFNDSLDLSNYDISKLSIYNRYGMEVYSKINYINEWAGQSANGSDLPTGTYYYIIESYSGESRTGWVYINRQE